MGLQGSLDTMSALQLGRFLAEKSASGTLVIRRQQVSKTIALDSGRVINAASTDPREYFGQFLVNFGIISEDQLQKAFETQQETKVMLGKILVMTGIVSQEQIHRMLELKIRESLLDAFLWDQGRFDFQDGLVRDEQSVVPAAVELAALCQEGEQRRRLLVEIRGLIPDNNCRFRCHDQAIPANLDQRSASAAMLRLAREGSSVAEIILRFHSVDFPILKGLYDMVRQGWLTVEAAAGSPPDDDIPEVEIIEINEAVDQAAAASPEPAPAPATAPAAATLDTPDSFLAAAQQQITARDFDGAIKLLKQGLDMHPYDPELCEALELAEKGLSESLRASLLADKKIPYLLRDDVLRISANWTPAQRYLLSRIDGNRTLRSIIMVSPLKEVEALQTFRQLVKVGIVGLR